MTSKTLRLNNEERTLICRAMVKLHRSGAPFNQILFTRTWDKIKNEDEKPWTRGN